MADRLKAAVIGHGKVGQIRRACIENHPRLELVAVCDIDPSQAYGGGCQFYQDWRQVLTLRPDLVFICTTNEYIPKIAVAALELGIHTFCEKPPGRTVEDVQQVMEAERCHAGVKLRFGFNHRYHRAVLDAEAIVKKKRLGEILWMRGIYGKAGGSQYDRNWRTDPKRSGGGILIDQGIHMLDLFHLFVGRFDEVKSFVGQLYWQVPVEDNAVAVLRNSKGQIAMLHSSATQWRHTFILDIYLERGYLSLDGILSSTRTYGRESLRVAHCLYDDEGYPLPNPSETITYYDDDQSWALEVDEFVQCILEDRPIVVGSSVDALAAMEVVHQIYAQDSKWQRPTRRSDN